MGRNQKGGQKVKRGRKVRRVFKISHPVKFCRGCEIFATLAKFAMLLFEIFAYAIFFRTEALNSNRFLHACAESLTSIYSL